MSLADRLGLPVIAELRQADLAAGGQGAPIVPAYHAALARRLALEYPAAFLNIGGIANVTWIGSGGEIIAFDTGPGNGLIDLTVQARGLGQYDNEGQLARSGSVDDSVLTGLLNSAYFGVAGPNRSTGMIFRSTSYRASAQATR